MAATAVSNVDALISRRSSALARLQDLQQQRGAALLETGGAPENLNAAIATAQQELDAIAEALAEAHRQERARLALDQAARDAALRDRLAAAEQARVNAIAEAEAAARVFSEAVRDCLSAEREVLQAVAGLRGVTPQAFLPGELLRRLSGRLSKALGAATGDFNHFGAVELWQLPGGEPDGGPGCWSRAEALEGERALAAIVNVEGKRA